MTILTPATILSRVQRTFGDEAEIQVTTADVIAWINDAQRECVMQLENLLQNTTTIAITAQARDYTLPTELLTLQSVAYKTTLDVNASFYPLRYLNPKEFTEYMNPGYDGKDLGYGTPQVYTRGYVEGKISFYPIPDSSVAQARIVYSRYSFDINDIIGSLDLPEYLHQYVLEYCLMKAYEMDENWEASDRKAQYVQSTLDFNNNRESWFGREVYPSVVATSEDYL